MSILDWFDPKNKEHLKSLKHLLDTGQWPINFIPSGMVYPSGWDTTLMYRLARIYLDTAVYIIQEKERLQHENSV